MISNLKKAFIVLLASAGYSGISTVFAAPTQPNKPAAAAEYAVSSLCSLVDPNAYGCTKHATTLTHPTTGSPNTKAALAVSSYFHLIESSIINCTKIISGAETHHVKTEILARPFPDVSSGSPEAADPPTVDTFANSTNGHESKATRQHVPRQTPRKPLNFDLDKPTKVYIPVFKSQVPDLALHKGPYLPSDSSDPHPELRHKFNGIKIFNPEGTTLFLMLLHLLLTTLVIRHAFMCILCGGCC